jgi:DNA polymerase I-like protein with 3'-5' exonuclease and polymerase domains
MPNLILDCETRGIPPFQFQPKHPQFGVLFQGIKIGNKIVQDSDIYHLKNETVVGANTKFDTKSACEKAGMTIENCFIRDVEVDCHLLRSDLSSYHLVDLATVHGYPFPHWKNFIDWKELYWEDEELLKWYNRHDLCSTEWVGDRVQPYIEKFGLLPLQNLMSDFIWVVSQMELEGIQVDSFCHSDFIAKHKIRADSIRDCLLDISNIDWNSNQQIAEYFRNQGEVLPKTDKGQDSVDENSLKNIDHPVAKILLEYRGECKQYQTYGLGFVDTLIGWKYYPDYKLIGTKTGRLSEKFIQVMPRKTVSEFKQCIISKYPGGKLITADWSQLEIRLNAELAFSVTGKRNLLDDLINGVDLHSETLRRFPSLPDRTRAKNVNFSVFFGGQGYTLVHDYGLTVEEARAIRHDLIEVRYPEMKGYFDYVEKSIVTKGLIVNPYTGRRRFTSSFPEGYNSPIQGMGSDFNKIMMIKLWKMFVKYGYRSRPIAEIHDEIVIDSPAEEVQDILIIVQNEYKAFPEYFYEYFGKNLVCQYGTEIKIGSNLLEVQPI